MSMMTYTNPLSEIREQIERLFSDFTEENRMSMQPMQKAWPSTSMRTTTWLPPIEVTESEKELIVSASLPGMKPENINVEVVGNSLVLSGESRRENKVDEKHFHRSEFQYGQFMRRIPLPDFVNGEQCQAEFNNGVLEIHLPKMEGAKAKKIQVKTSQ
jgi:HSP20 family protein